MKVTQRIPTTTYGFIEIEMDYDSPDEAIIDHDRLVKLYEEAGIPPREWTKVRRQMLIDGTFDPNLWEECSKAQRYWINETKKTLRDINHETDTTGA